MYFLIISEDTFCTFFFDFNLSTFILIFIFFFFIYVSATTKAFANLC